LKRVTILLFITGGLLFVGIFKGLIEALKSLRVAASFVGGWGGGLNSDAASCKIFIISKCFHRSKQELKKYFSIHLRCKKLKTIGAYTESSDLILKALKKMIHLVTLSL
jgi:hypothetical protein